MLRIWISCVLALWLVTPGAASADGTPLGDALDAMRAGDWDAARARARADGQVAEDIIAWHWLRSGRGTYADVTAFLDRRWDWPALGYIRRQSEEEVAGVSDEAILAFFATRPAETAEGALAHARALGRAGEGDAVRQVVTDAWLTMAMSDRQQSMFVDRYGVIVKPLVGDRLDRMLWKGWEENARRVMPLASRTDRRLAEARMGLRRLANNVDNLIAAVPEASRDAPGLAHARFEWRVRKGRWADAKDLLLTHSASAAMLGEPEAWANRRRELARDELRDGSARQAYRIASTHHLEAGAHYADLEWLSGYIALMRLDDPARALAHFENHDNAVRSPISRGRAGYWTGRAHLALGDVAAADMAFTRGAAYQTSFYGLLAAEAAGLPFDVGFASVPETPWADSVMARDSLFVAGRLLLAAGERNLAELFWVHLAEQLGESDAALLGQAAIDLGEPHLAVMVGKAVARRGVILPIPYFPLHPLAEADLPVPPELALAVARRESEFDPVVVSGAGARGLMQLMPATAREMAGDLGLTREHSLARLTADPVYNARLGTVYLDELAGTFGGNVVMIAAGYNAGPSRPERWMRLYGDPRGGDLDAMIDWIESIPFRETRNYVMRVTEGLPIFRARLGLDPLPVPFSAELLGASVAQGG